MAEATTEHVPDLIYGVPAIAGSLGMSEKQCRHRVDAAQIPTFKIGGTICARRSTLTAWLAEQEAMAQRGGVNG